MESHQENISARSGNGSTSGFIDSKKRQQFRLDRNNYEPLQEIDSTYLKNRSEPMKQIGRGQKRPHDEVNDGAGVDLKKQNKPKEPSHKLLQAMAKEKGIIYTGIMNKKQLIRVLSLNKQDPTILCLPEVENSRNNYRELHREKARETSRRWRRENPEKSAAHWARREDLTEIGLLNWGVKKNERVPGENWKTKPSKSASATE